MVLLKPNEIVAALSVGFQFSIFMSIFIFIFVSVLVLVFVSISIWWFLVMEKQMVHIGRVALRA